MKRSEILAPAGNLDILKQVVNAGADAVYFGGDLFGARAFAKNFSIEDAREGIRYAHMHGADAYLTVNTLLKNKEIEQHLYEYLKSYYESGLDAFIVQDMAVFQMIRTYFPEIDVHASTQMTVASSLGAKLLEDLGATRVVTSREMSLAEIKRIKETTNLEIETFVHGALCVCYSGDCLMSSILGGRSGNRGRCAQPCRLPYDVYDENGQIKTGGKYVLSPKDSCGILDLKEMLESGVYSFKIEGRMKSSNYAANVTAIYRRVMDEILEGRDPNKLGEDFYQELLDLGNRNGFTDLYFHKQNGKELMSLTSPSHENTGVDLPEFAEEKISLSAEFMAHVGQPMNLSLKTKEGDLAYVEGPVVEAASKNPADEADVMKRLRKTGGTQYVIEEIAVDLQGDVFLPVKALNQLRRDALEQMSEILDLDTKERTADIPEEKREHQKNHRIDHPNTMVTVSTWEQLEVVSQYEWVDYVGIRHNLYLEKPEMIRAFSKNHPSILMLPDVFRKKAEDRFNMVFEPEDLERFSMFMAASYDGLYYLLSKGVAKDKIQLDHRIYTFSNDALDAFRKQGYQHFTAPYELNQQELRYRENWDSTFIVYSYIPLMVMANCTHKNFEGCDKKLRKLSLEDRYQKRFPVRNDCSICMNTIYNTIPYEVISRPEVKDLGFGSLRLDFTIEEGKEIHRVMKAYEQAMIEGRAVTFPVDATRGHFKRGVE